MRFVVAFRNARFWMLMVENWQFRVELRADTAGNAKSVFKPDFDKSGGIKTIAFVHHE